MTKLRAPPTLQTARLALRHLSTEDGAFMCELLNDQDFILNVGDRGVRTPADARAYVETGPVAAYTHSGFGMFRVALRESDEPVGICTLLKRDTLAHPDLGFALLPAFRARGYAIESGAAVKAYARDTLSLARLVAIALATNASSVRVLGALGFRAESTLRWTEDGAELTLFGCNL